MTTELLQTDQLIATKSVTDPDIPKSVYYVSFYPNLLQGLGSAIVLPNLLPASIPRYYSRQGDVILYESGKFEGRWASAVAIACSKVAARAFDLKSDKPQLLKRYQELLHDFEGKGKNPVWFFKKLARDYLTTDNGCFIEIDRESAGAGSRIKGLHVLDSRRVIRTGVPDTPAVYIDLQGGYHELKDYQVIDIVDQPDTTANTYGVGECAARRAYKTIRWLNTIDQFRYEKLAGARPLAIDFISGITEEQLTDTLKTQEAERQMKGVSVYGGTVLVPMMKGGIEHTRVPMAELPDKFDYQQERNLALQDYANAIGLDSQEILPLTGAALGTATQSQVLDDKEEGKGLATLFVEISHLMNTYVLPDTVTFAWNERADYRNQQMKAQVFSTYATALTGLVDKGLITAQQALNKLVDEDQLPQEFLPVDETASVTLADTEKLQAIQAQQEAAQGAVSDIGQQLSQALPGDTANA